MSITINPGTKDPVEALRNIDPRSIGRPFNDYCSRKRLMAFDSKLVEDCRALRATAQAFTEAGDKSAAQAMTRLATAFDKARRSIEVAFKAIGDDPHWLPGFNE